MEKGNTIKPLLDKLQLDAEDQLSILNGEYDVDAIAVKVKNNYGALLKEDKDFMSPINSRIKHEERTKLETHCRKVYGLSAEEMEGKSTTEEIIVYGIEKVRKAERDLVADKTESALAKDVQQLTDIVAKKERIISEYEEFRIPAIKTEAKKEYDEKVKMLDLKERVSELSDLTCDKKTALAIIKDALLEDNYRLGYRNNRLDLLTKDDSQVFEDDKPIDLNRYMDKIFTSRKFKKQSNAYNNGYNVDKNLSNTAISNPTQLPPTKQLVNGTKNDSPGLKKALDNLEMLGKQRG